MKYFISGHRDLTKEEFEKHYVPIIEKLINGNDLDLTFVIGDWMGCDKMVMDHLEDLLIEEGITLEIHCVNKFQNTPGNVPEKYLYSCFGEFISTYYHNTYDECDEAMTKNSDFDIAWIRPGKEDSHTANNIKRRYYGSYKKEIN